MKEAEAVWMIVIIIITVCITALTTWAVTDGGWTKDCQKIGSHVGSDGKAYTCKERDK